MNPVDNITWIDTGTVPDPLVTPTGSLAPTQGKLVQIQGTALSMTGTTNKTILFNDGSGQTTVYIYGLTGIDTSSFTFPMPMRVTGMSGAYNTPQVNPRFQADIVDLRPPTVTGTNPANAATRRQSLPPTDRPPSARRWIQRASTQRHSPWLIQWER